MSSWGDEADVPRINGRGVTGRRGDAADDAGVNGVGGVDDAGVIDTGVIEAVVIEPGDAGAPQVGDATVVDEATVAGDETSSSSSEQAPPDPSDGPSATATTAEVVLWEGPAPGDDPLPSTGSLRWAPDATEPLPALPPGPPAGPSGATAPVVIPPGQGGPSGWSGPRDRSDPSVWQSPPGAGGRSVFADPPAPAASSGAAGPPGPAHHLAPGSPQPGGGHTPGRRQPDRPTLVGVGVLVAFVVVSSAILITRDGGGSADPGDAAGPSTTLVVGDGTDPAGPIVGPTGVIGSWSGAEWLPRPDGEQPGAEHDYAVVGLTEAVGSARAEAVAEECPAQRATSEVDVAVDLDAGSGPPPIAVARVAEPRPREVQQFGTDSEVYRQAAAEVAAGLGATEPPTVSQVLRSDLDGDGTDEVVVAAGHVSDPEDLSPEAGDWSAVFLRRVAAGGVATDVLASSVAGSDGFDHIEVATLADLNGDGTMEVALAGRSSTGEWTSIHALGSDGVPSEVLRAGCED